ncbi:glycosyltransferase family 2 protein [Flavobacterium myungsuense]|uniref:Glycosyltransferase family 2 protein n=1 Tax=Flavobacterium myungsuense TaxID=651823 RepID=A0ABW3IZ33_9FLAO
MDISIVIVNFRGWKALEKCLDSLEKIISQTFSFEVIIVDNYSNDGQFFIFEKKYKKFIFIENIGNYGFSNGCNRGALLSKGKYILFLNPDTSISFNALEILLQTAISHPKIGVLSCLQIDEKGNHYKQNLLFPNFVRFFGILRSLHRTFNKAKLKKRFTTTNDLFYPDWVSGAVLFISREWFDKINGWNEDYWLYFEDVDICKKIAKIGGKVAVTKNVTIFHQHGGASRINIKTKALTKTEVIISKHVYISNNFSGIKRFYLHSLLLIGTLFGKSILAFFGMLLFFIPKLEVNQLILKNSCIYYFNALKMKTWISPRAMNYPKNKA